MPRPKGSKNKNPYPEEGKLRGEKNPRFGKHRSDETKKKISQSLLGRPLAEITKAKLSGSNSHMWKGGLYIYYHGKARELFGKPYCEDCGISLEEYSQNKKKHQKKQFDMHCINKDYIILEQWNWKCLCRKCHLYIHREEV